MDIPAISLGLNGKWMSELGLSELGFLGLVGFIGYIIHFTRF